MIIHFDPKEEIYEICLKSIETVTHKIFIISVNGKLQLFAFKVVPFSFDPLCHPLLPCFYALLMGFLPDHLELLCQDLFYGFYIFKMCSFDDFFEFWKEKVAESQIR